jgi:hypothetical protein
MESEPKNCFALTISMLETIKLLAFKHNRNIVAYLQTEISSSNMLQQCESWSQIMIRTRQLPVNLQALVHEYHCALFLS